MPDTPRMRLLIATLVITVSLFVSGLTTKASTFVLDVTSTAGASQTDSPTVVAQNADWTPVIESFGGVEMALVPPGCYMMGLEGMMLAEPVHEVCFDQPFWIDRAEVSNGQFAQFGGQAAQPSRWTGADRPRESITWFEARDFCLLRGMRLPTEAEWEYAARGPDGLLYPWGDEFIEANAVFGENASGQTGQVGSQLDGASWVGALDLSGNVWEWTNSLDWAYPYQSQDGREADTGPGPGVKRVLRGGNWSTVRPNLRSSIRYSSSPEGVSDTLGFRCADSFVALAEDALTPTPTPGLVTLGDPVPSPVHNADWTPVVQSFDGVQMVLVPPGCFEMGSDEGIADQRPAHPQCFDAPYWLDQVEVSNEQFARFGGLAEHVSRWPDADRPREMITWYEAWQFCALRGARLPTEAEWEYAARGLDALMYPWGNEFLSDNATYAGNAGGHTASVGSRAGGASWVGALDLSGNVGEWTSSREMPYPYRVGDGREDHTASGATPKRVIRGGAWSSEDYLVHASNRVGSAADGPFPVIGFRCARAY